MKVLFVCTGNVFRSMTADYCLKDYLETNGLNGIIVSSAGILGGNYQLLPVIIESMKEQGIDISGHKPRGLTSELLLEQNIIIAMAKNHKEFIKREYGLGSVLFNELAHNLDTSVLDVPDVIPDWRLDPPGLRNFVNETVNYIKNSTPELYNKLVSEGNT